MAVLFSYHNADDQRIRHQTADLFAAMSFYAYEL